jgi:ABC-2 type transport system permease protein
MLWYKAWLETRTRFLIALTGMTVLCAWRVYDLNHQAPSWATLNYYYFTLRSGHELLNFMWLIAVTLLMMGGLLQEKSNGSISFTLALPESRARLMAVRIGAGLLEAAALLTVPCAAIYGVAWLTGPAHSLKQVLFYLLILASGGAVFAGTALLISSLVEGAYTAPTISAGILLLCGNAPKSWAFVNPMDFMSPRNHIGDANLVTGPWPWGHAAVYLAVASILIWTSVRVVLRRDL